ncbi:hypothetical protein ABK046_48955, partial [Streptomyces caeruleatus]
CLAFHFRESHTGQVGARMFLAEKNERREKRDQDLHASAFFGLFRFFRLTPSGIYPSRRSPTTLEPLMRR